MKLQAEIDGKTSDVEVRRDGDRLFARVDGQEYELEVSEPEPGVFLLKHNGCVFNTFALERSDGSIEVNLNGKSFSIQVTDPKRLRGSGSEHSHDHGLVEIKTAMPGKVVRILTAVGKSVEKGSGVIVVEAMKMQNEMRSPKDGVIKEIRVSEGVTVNAGEVLVVIE
jgi:biotin carboxyl carrier protein